MGEQIDQILWQEQHQRMEVAYLEREPHRVVADRLVATMLARDAGLVLVPGPPGTVRWVRRASDLVCRT